MPYENQAIGAGPTLTYSGLRHEWLSRFGPALLVVAVVVAIKLALIAVDPHVRVFLGDSVQFLHHAWAGGALRAHSPSYPFVIHLTAWATGSMLSLLLAQTTFGALTALIVFHILRVDFRADFRIAGAAAAAVAAEPAQLFHERLVMAESAGCLTFLAFLLAGLLYLRSGRLRWLILQALLGLLTTTFRMNLLPVVLGLAPVPPLLLWLAADSEGRRRGPAWRAAAHVAFALALTAGVHHAFKVMRSLPTSRGSDYFAHADFFRLGLVAPLIGPEDFAGTDVSPAVLAQVSPPHADPRNRLAQIWGPNGLSAVLRRAAGPRAGAVADRLVRSAVRRDPFGIVRLGLANTRDYFDPAMALARMRTEQGIHRPLRPRDVASWREHFHYDFRAFSETITSISAYYAASRGWLAACLVGLFPLVCLMLIANWGDARASAVLLFFASTGLVASQVLFSHVVAFRYLHVFPVLAILSTGATLGRLCIRSLTPKQGSPVLKDRGP